MAKVKLTGFREASRQLNEMSKAAAQGVGRRALQVPAGILRDEMRARVPVDSGALRNSIEVRKERSRRSRPQVGVIADDIAAVPVEYGNPAPGRVQAAHPYARPALDAKQNEMLDRFGSALKQEVDRTVIRANKRASKG